MSPGFHDSMNQFKLPPISTLSGSTLGNFFKVLKQGHVAPKYYLKIVLTFLVILIATPFHFWENLFFRKKLKQFKFTKAPVFILGHWRSGTTLLHNTLCVDPSAGYVTTYQSVFPNNLASKWLFKTFMKINMPKKRPTDNILLNIDAPQEDEFAFANMQAYAYYNFFYFPVQYRTFYDNAVHHKNLDENKKNKWFKTYDRLLKKALINSKGERLIVKNPVNTARTKHLLKLYPDAKFIYIYRNPITVILSTQRFFKGLFPTLILQKMEDTFLYEMIFDVYNRLLDDYLQQKALIPDKNLLEIRYEDFEKNPSRVIKQIYSDILLEDFDKVKGRYYAYFDSIEEYVKNKYEIEKTKIDEIKKHTSRFMTLYKYDVPEEIIIK